MPMTVTPHEAAGIGPATWHSQSGPDGVSWEIGGSMCPFRMGLTQGGGQPRLEAAGIEPVNKAIENPKQDALLPAIALILLRFVIPPRPTLFPRVPPRTTLEGHTEGTCGPTR
jgi:hypothetical protein